jgi:hypothetical protein
MAWAFIGFHIPELTSQLYRRATALKLYESVTLFAIHGSYAGLISKKSCKGYVAHTYT